MLGFLTPTLTLRQPTYELMTTVGLVLAVFYLCGVLCIVICLFYGLFESIYVVLTGLCSFYFRIRCF